jgi:hypothetical protein
MAAGRAVWQEDGKREQCEAASEEKLAAKLEKVTERIRADAANMKRSDAHLISHYLDPDRLPVKDRWSRKHAHTQRRLCERFAAPVIDAVTCRDIKTEHTQRIVNAAPTVTAAGESVVWVDPAEILSDDISKLGRPGAGHRAARRPGRADGQHRRLHRAALGRAGCPHRLPDRPGRPRHHGRRKVVEAAHLYVEAPKNRKHRRTIYPRRTPTGYPLADKLAARTDQARAEQEAGANPLGRMFPSPTGKHWRSSNFQRNVLKRAHR